MKKIKNNSGKIFSNKKQKRKIGLEKDPNEQIVLSKKILKNPRIFNDDFDDDDGTDEILAKYGY